MIASDALDVDKILALHAYFGGTILQGDAWDLRTAADFENGTRWRHEARIRLSAGGNVFDQPLQELQSKRGRELDP